MQPWEHDKYVALCIGHEGMTNRLCCMYFVSVEASTVWGVVVEVENLLLLYYIVLLTYHISVQISVDARVVLWAD